MNPFARLVLLSWLPFAAAPAGADEVQAPIRKVVLYQHGVGSFVRVGRVSGDGTLTLRFRERDMSDAIKSLTALDLDGGRVASIAYDSQKPFDKRLEEFGFELPAEGALEAAVKRLRGARVALDLAGRGRVEGSLLGLDERMEVGPSGSEHKVPRVTLLTDDGGVVSVDLFDLKRMEFLDEELRAELERYAQVLRSAYRGGDKTIRLRLSGEGERRVLVAYTIEQPAWKATYRLVLPDSGGAGKGEALLQGWAVVDNVTDEDWSGVELLLVAGRPISYVIDLYTPRYVPRSSLADLFATLGREAAARLRRLGFVAEAKKDGRFGRESASPGATAPGAPRAAAYDAEELADALVRQEVRVATESLGRLLEYRIREPVDLERDSSALLPILQARVEGEAVSLYSEARDARHPFESVRLVNSTELTLEDGPVTVYRQGGDRYVGESYMPLLTPGERRYLPFALDVGVDATTRLDTKVENIARLVVRDGVVLTYRDRVETRTYTFRNDDDEDRTIVVEHPRRNGYRLLEPEEVFEKDLKVLRFRVAVPAGEEKALAVKEAFRQSSSIRLTDVTTDTIRLWQDQGVDADRLREVLAPLFELQSRIADLDRRIEEAETRRKGLFEDQSRLRENLKALGGSVEEKDLRRVYVERLRASESRLDEIREELAALREQRAKLEAELRKLLETLSFEWSA